MYLLCTGFVLFPQNNFHGLHKTHAGLESAVLWPTEVLQEPYNFSHLSEYTRLQIFIIFSRIFLAYAQDNFGLLRIPKPGFLQIPSTLTRIIVNLLACIASVSLDFVPFCSSTVWILRQERKKRRRRRKGSGELSLSPLSPPSSVFFALSQFPPVHTANVATT